MPTDPQDPSDPSDPSDPQDPKSPPGERGVEAPEEVDPTLGLEPEPTMDLEEDSAITEEVAIPTSAVSAPAAAPEPPRVVPLQPTGFEPPASNPGAGQEQSGPSMGQLVRFGIMLGLGLGLFFGVPYCGEITSWALPPLFGGILLTLYSARWQGVEAIDPQRLSMGAAMMGVVMGGIVTVGMGITAYFGMDMIEAELATAGQGQFSPGQVLMVGMICMLPFTQLVYAGLGILSARWTLAKLKPGPR